VDIATKSVSSPTALRLRYEELLSPVYTSTTYMATSAAVGGSTSASATDTNEESSPPAPATHTKPRTKPITKEAKAKYDEHQLVRAQITRQLINYKNEEYGREAS